MHLLQSLTRRLRAFCAASTFPLPLRTPSFTAPFVLSGFATPEDPLIPTRLLWREPSAASLLQLPIQALEYVHTEDPHTVSYTMFTPFSGSLRKSSLFVSLERSTAFGGHLVHSIGQQSPFIN